MEQEVRKTKKRKEEHRLAFEAGKVFGLDEIPGPKGHDLEEIAQQAELDKQAREYRARKGEGGDRSRIYGLS